MSNRPSISLIITTYNWPQALALVLQSAIKQSLLPDEIIVADDGSTSETQELVQQFSQTSPVPIIHAWQEDKGFRLSRSRNNAVKQARGDYLIFVDGDTVLHKDFVKDHARFAEKQTFVVGSRVLMPEDETKRFFQQNQFTFSLFKSGASNKLNALHVPFLGQIIAEARNAPIEQLIFKVRGCNMAFWRSDYLAVNGFNQAFCGWGREDSEFALRLFKYGLSMKRVKFAAIQYHLYHPENDRTGLDENDEILQQMLSSDGYTCESGINQI